MSYSREAIDASSTPKEKVVESMSKNKQMLNSRYSWWLAQNDSDLLTQCLSTIEYLKKTNAIRIRQASIFSRLFCGKPLSNFLASNASLDSSNQMPIGRPTANVVYSCTDTLVSRISQDRPKPTFLTDGGNYKERRMADEGNAFIQGEFYRTNAYAKGTLALRDACVLADGFLKVYAKDNKVCIDRTLATELLCDFNDGYYGNPRELGHLKLVDKGVLMDMHPKSESIIAGAANGSVDSTPRSTETIADQCITGELWHLPSGEGASDGRHVIVCSNGILLDETWDKNKFPFAKVQYNPTVVGFFSQGLAEILMPTQMEIYRMLIVASQAIELMGVPRIYIDEMSKIMETSFNNRIGTIIKGRGNPPEFLNATSNPPEIYQWIQWLIANAYQMSGISSMSAQGVKPEGLNSGEAIRSFDALQQDRFARLAKGYQDLYPELSYLMIDTAKDIVDETGSYLTVYPGKDGTREVDFKHISILKDTYVIQCFEESSLPKDPAGRQAKLSEMLAAGEITNQEFRRLSNLPDLKQSDQLAAALEERILHDLDSIIEDGKRGYNTPDAFILDPTDLATTLTVQTINKYAVTNLEESKMQLLRDYFTAIQNLKAQAAPPPPPQAPPQGAPQGQQLPVAPPNPSVAPTSGAQV
jgi:hypothetical protein